MAELRFQPGFRISAVDLAVIVISLIASFVLWAQIWWIGFVILFVVAHFFLFCNVFRISRVLELIWAMIFVVLAYCTLVLESPSWVITIAGSLVATATLIAIEMQKPWYHGILRQRINPKLPEWWEMRNQLPS
jgi:hypothetical protein